MSRAAALGIDRTSDSPARRAMRRFWRSKMVWLGMALLAIEVSASLVGFLYARHDKRYDRQDLAHVLERPSMSHLFGRDRLGRDLMVRTLYGGGLSLAVGLMAALISVTIGVTWGAVAGYFGGRIDGVMMRFVDVLYGLPYILLVILIKVAFETPLAEILGSRDQPATGTASVIVLFLAIGAVSWLTMARVVRGQVLSLKNNDYVAAAVAAGAGPWRIIRVHLLPNLLGPIIVYATLIIPQAILQESFLSFLGIGVQAPMASWGSLASDGVAAMNPVISRWWLVFFPCLMLAATLLSLNLIGDGLRDAFDPQLKRRK
ncbi:MAG: Dipeptide transport system permease protein DppC [Phycisphaerae bacterium]|nr:Dipeptide transport system permease protein DppC [Phycisphaerae bacterium]